MNPMTIEWIGSGSAMNYELGNANFLISNAQSGVLVDISAGTANALLHRKRLASIQHIIVTHVHGDHMDGLEGLGFFNWNALGKTGDQRPTLHVPDERILQALRSSLYEKMRYQQMPDNAPFEADLEFYFRTRVGECVEIGSLPPILFHEALHAQGMPCYGVSVPDAGLWISGDSRDARPLPPDIVLAFRDAAGPDTPTRIHASLDLDLSALDPQEKARTFLYHLGGNWRSVHANLCGFAGIVLPGDRFTLHEHGYAHDRGGAFTHAMVPYDR